MLIHWVPFLALAALVVQSNGDGFENISVKAERVVDITAQVVKVTVKYEIRNNRSESVGDFVHLLSDVEETGLAFVTALAAPRLEESLTLTVSKYDLKDFPKGFVAYKVKLSKLLFPGESTSINVEYQLTNSLKPLPATISQNEAQFMLYTGNAHVASVYELTEEKSSFKLPRGKLVSHTAVEPTKRLDHVIAYGPYYSVMPFTVKEIKVHNENNAPFVVATKVERTIEVSHWGNIAVEENIFLMHKGALMKGSFSRLDYGRDPHRSSPILAAYKTLLPSSAKDIYCRDEVGLIWSWKQRKLDDAVELNLRPRFPLFGGWRIDYTLGYNVPAYQYLYTSEQNMALQMRLRDHLFDGTVVEHLKVKVILPEGSRNFALTTPYPVRRLPDEVRYSYLDTTGKPVIVFEKRNLVDAHIQQFTLHYEFDRIWMWRKPLLASAGFSLLFLTVIIGVRLNFTIVEDEMDENRLKAHGFVAKLHELHEERMNNFTEFMDVLEGCVAHREVTKFLNTKKKADADLKAGTAAFAEVLSELKVEHPESFEKLSEIPKLHKAGQEILSNFLVQAERAVRGQGGKMTFSDAQKTFTRKMDDLNEKIEILVSSAF